MLQPVVSRRCLDLGFDNFLEDKFGVFYNRFSMVSQRPDVPGERKRIEAEGAAGSPVQGHSTKTEIVRPSYQ